MSLLSKCFTFISGQTFQNYNWSYYGNPNPIQDHWPKLWYMFILHESPHFWELSPEHGIEHSDWGAGDMVGLSLPHQHSLACSTPAYTYPWSSKHSFLHLSMVNLSSLFATRNGKSLLESSKHSPFRPKKAYSMIVKDQTMKRLLKGL